ncbi:MAG: hypothetical protein LBL74_00995 [Bacteroidales bacterium]|jgi:hypothetical protein|nr:hypothetical protein [Bacteroidales bacterium]
MKSVTLFIVSFLLISGVSSQSQYSNIQKNVSNDTVIFSINKKNISIISRIDAGGLLVASINGDNTLKYKADDYGMSFGYALFYNDDIDDGFLFIHKQLEYSRGCEIFHLSGNRLRHIGYLPVAAYIKEGKSMNYSNILSYLSIINISNRTLINFETPLLVINPSHKDEKIINSKDLFFTYTDGKLQMQYNQSH